MVGEKSVALGEGKDNYDGSYKMIRTCCSIKRKKKTILITQLYLLARTNRKSSTKLRVVLKKCVQDKRWEKLSESCISRKIMISELLLRKN